MKIVARKYWYVSGVLGMILLIYIFKIDLEDTLLFTIAEQTVNNNFILWYVMIIALAVGLTFKNKDKYFSLFIDIEIILATISLLAYSIIGDLDCRSDGFYKYVVMFAIIVALLIVNNVEKLIKTKPKGSSKPFFSFAKNRLTKFKSQNELLGEDISTNINYHSHYPTETSKEVFKSRQSQLNGLYNVLNDSISYNGYSICVSGEWGSGKTSFINGVIDKCKNDEKAKYIFEEIRINAMELDDLDSLVNYFFKRIKDILKTNGAYVGISSEYQNLISSLMGNITTKSMGSFIGNKLNSNMDYRENLNSLEKLIVSILPNIKIIIIVDDIERCSGEKTKEYLFFIKEIAMLKQCVTIFLVYYPALINKLEEGEDFLDKFFNRIVNLADIPNEEILNELKMDADFLAYINSLNKMFEEEISKAKEEQYPYVTGSEIREKMKNDSIDRKMNLNQTFQNMTSNPRKMVKTNEQYALLEKIVKQQIIKCPDPKKSELDAFINKVNYKKQIAILSLFYAFFPQHYEKIETQEVRKYLSWIEKYDDEPKVLIKSLINNEWIDSLSGTTDSSNYIVQEKIRFIDCLLNKPEELCNIANGYSTIQGEYISKVKAQEALGKGSFVKVMNELYSARHYNKENDTNIIKDAYILYKNERTDNFNFNDAVKTLGSTKSYELPGVDIVQEFDEVFCSDKSFKIIDKKECIRVFETFAKEYLSKKIINIFQYLTISVSDGKISRISKISEVFLDNESINGSILKYCNQINVILQSEITSSDDSLVFLRNIIDYADKCYDNGINEFSGTKELKTKAEEQFRKLEHLFNIENFINESNDESQKNIFNDFKEILKYLNTLSGKENRDDNNEIFIKLEGLMQEEVQKSVQLNTEKLQVIKDCIDKYFDTFKDVGIFISLIRQFLVIEKHNNTIKDK